MFKVHRSFNLSTGVKNNSIAVVFDSSTDSTMVVYHKTMVFRLDSEKVIRIDNGGYDTVSTRAVINQALSEACSDFSLERVKGVTMLVHKSIVNTISIPFLGRAFLYNGGRVSQWSESGKNEVITFADGVAVAS